MDTRSLYFIFEFKIGSKLEFKSIIFQNLQRLILVYSSESENIGETENKISNYLHGRMDVDSSELIIIEQFIYRKNNSLQIYNPYKSIELFTFIRLII